MDENERPFAALIGDLELHVHLTDDDLSRCTKGRDFGHAC